MSNIGMFNMSMPIVHWTMSSMPIVQHVHCPPCLCHHVTMFGRRRNCSSLLNSCRLIREEILRRSKDDFGSQSLWKWFFVFIVEWMWLRELSMSSIGQRIQIALSALWPSSLTLCTSLSSYSSTNISMTTVTSSMVQLHILLPTFHVTPVPPPCRPHIGLDHHLNDDHQL